MHSPATIAPDAPLHSPGLEWGEENPEQLRCRDEAGDVTVRADGLRMSYSTFAEQSDFTSRLVLIVQQLEVLDRLIIAPFNKLLTDLKSDDVGLRRKTVLPMLRVEHVVVRGSGSGEEDVLVVELLPLRLHMSAAPRARPGTRAR